jgi:hypothetical protein
LPAKLTARTNQKRQPGTIDEDNAMSIFPFAHESKVDLKGAREGIPRDPKEAAAQPSQLCSSALAEAALQHMKGVRVTIEGVDDCVVAFLASLPPASVLWLVREWGRHGGFPTVSDLSELLEAAGGQREGTA